MRRARRTVLVWVGVVAVACVGAAHMASNTVAPSYAGETAVSMSIAPIDPPCATATELTGPATTLGGDATTTAGTTTTTTAQTTTTDQASSTSGLVTTTTCGSG